MHSEADRTAVAWPEWMLRYVASGTREAFEELVWSVGGSPPWGGVSWEEAEAVYELVEAYQGAGEAPESAYRKALDLAGDRRRVLALEVFRLHDRIASAPDRFGEDDVEAGLALARESEHGPLTAYFQTLRAQLLHLGGQVTDALELTRAAMMTFTIAGIQDPVYATNARNAGQNAVSFAALDGDFRLARAMIEQIRPLGLPDGFQQLDRLLGERPDFPSSLDEVDRRAGDLLEEGHALRALEWYAEAERLAAADGARLCGIIGDKAVAFRRLGNDRRAMETYLRAIELCRRHGRDDLLSAWTSNVGQLLLQGGRYDEAKSHFDESLAAAARAQDPEKLTIAARNLGALLAERGRFADAVESLDRAAALPSDDSTVRAALRQTRASVLLTWAEHQRQAGQDSAALLCYRKAIEGLELRTAEEAEAAMRAWVAIAAIEERRNDLPAAVEAVDRATGLARALRDRDMVGQLEALKATLSRKGLLL
jgi:tetratricopeptide (TPR) repeat protein